MIRKLFVHSIFVVLFVEYSNGAGDVNAGPVTTCNSISSASYPNPRKDDKISDTYFNNTVVKDPYRWMENPDCNETKDFIKAEMAITTPYLLKSPFRAEVEARYKELKDTLRYSDCLFQAGSKYYFFQFKDQVKFRVLYVQDSLTAPPRVFFDGGTVNSMIFDYAVSYDGQMFALSLQELGKPDGPCTVIFKHVEKGDIYKEKLKNADFVTSRIFTHDGKGFFYGGSLDSNGKPGALLTDSTKNYKTFYHVLGTDQSKDATVVEFPDQPNLLPVVDVSDDGKYLVITASSAEKPGGSVFFADLEKIKYNITGILERKPIVPTYEAYYDYVTNNENIFIFLTDKDSVKKKLITVDISSANIPASQKDLVPANDKYELTWAQPADTKYLILVYQEDTLNLQPVIQLHDVATGKMIKKFNLDVGSYQKLACEKKFKDVFLHLIPFHSPGIMYHCDLSKPSPEFEILKEIPVKNVDSKKFTTEVVLYPSKDGTKIPMFIAHKKDLQKNGNNPAYLLTYNEFTDGPFTPFNAMFISNFDGLAAVVITRGNIGYGDKWEQAGKLENKQTSFDDFQAAAEYLVAEKYTCSKLLTIYGGADGGLRTGACLNQRPDLFGCVIAWEGVMDMLRYDKMPIGKEWVIEYGSSNNPKQFPYLYKYSPLHNVNIPKDPKKQYPATLLVTFEHDDNAPTAHSLKFIATLQSQAKCHPNQTNPLLIKVIPDAEKQNENILVTNAVDEMSFIVSNIGIKYHP